MKQMFHIAAVVNMLMSMLCSITVEILRYYCGNSDVGYYEKDDLLSNGCQKKRGQFLYEPSY